MKNGKLGAPLKGATLIGTGPESMQRMIGNDMQLDEGIGTCGKGIKAPAATEPATGRADGRRQGLMPLSATPDHYGNRLCGLEALADRLSFGGTACKINQELHPRRFLEYDGGKSIKRHRRYAEYF